MSGMTIIWACSSVGYGSISRCVVEAVLLTYVDIIKMDVFVKSDEPHLCSKRDLSLDATIVFVATIWELIFTSIECTNDSFAESFKKAFVKRFLPDID